MRTADAKRLMQKTWFFENYVVSLGYGG